MKPIVYFNMMYSLIRILVSAQAQAAHTVYDNKNSAYDRVWRSAGVGTGVASARRARSLAEWAWGSARGAGSVAKNRKTAARSGIGRGFSAAGAIFSGVGAGF